MRQPAARVERSQWIAQFFIGRHLRKLAASIGEMVPRSAVTVLKGHKGKASKVEEGC
jgi:hypothetical protein